MEPRAEPAGTADAVVLLTNAAPAMLPMTVNDRATVRILVFMVLAHFSPVGIPDVLWISDV